MVDDVVLVINVEAKLLCVAVRELNKGTPFQCRLARSLADVEDGGHLCSSPSNNLGNADCAFPDHDLELQGQIREKLELHQGRGGLVLGEINL